MEIEETHAAQVFLAHHGFVKGLAPKHAPWPGLADDVRQQVFLAFIAEARRWDFDADPEPLLATMTRHGPLRYRGRIDEFSVSRRALDESEIGRAYRVDSAPDDH